MIASRSGKKWYIELLEVSDRLATASIESASGPPSRRIALAASRIASTRRRPRSCCGARHCPQSVSAAASPAGRAVVRSEGWGLGMVDSGAAR